ncbi:uncharacterized protein PFL1_00597 [Pseudozyma flocculosa PF-1]|uniref:uncharacterized protein n=1 Tax=Pseudozyma flocculosa PF-1 TaxID=1277687 RepID=UPI0004560ADC|nr:uncharacterized protein PFL1_00597 [Pseudozyma flocculosa PF-1]EPQ32401.1 hypothetical protein PFL1_00597 [Pseudozyma flocculosa PF-1]
MDPLMILFLHATTASMPDRRHRKDGYEVSPTVQPPAPSSGYARTRRSPRLPGQKVFMKRDVERFCQPVGLGRNVTDRIGSFRGRLRGAARYQPQVSADECSRQRCRQTPRPAVFTINLSQGPTA